MNLPAKLRARVAHGARILKAGLPGLWATVGLVIILVGGSVYAAVTWGVKHWPVGLSILVALVAVVAIEGSYRDYEALASDHAKELDGLTAKLNGELTEAAHQMLLVPPDDASDVLRAPDRLLVGESLYSPEGSYRLGLQADGNVIIYRREVDHDRKRVVEKAALTSGTARLDGEYYLTLTDDGRVVLGEVVDGHDKEIIGTNTTDRGAKALKLQDDGNLVLLSTSGAEWSAWAGDLRAPFAQRKLSGRLNFYRVEAL